MTAQDVIRSLETLDDNEVEKVREWLDAHIAEPPELVAAIDEGVRDLEAGRVTVFTREELTEKIKAWAGGSR